MKKPKLNLRGLTTLQKIRKAKSFVAAMTGNANFPGPNPPLAVIAAAAEQVATAFSDREQVRRQLDEQQTALENAEKMLDLLLTALAAYVAAASGGEVQRIVSSAMEVANAPVPVGLLPQVTNLRATTSPVEGAVMLRWKRMRHARCYELQTSADPVTPQSWESHDPVSKAKCQLTGLPSGARRWFRVRAIGSAGPGAWSDPIVRRVP